MRPRDQYGKTMGIRGCSKIKGRRVPESPIRVAFKDISSALIKEHGDYYWQTVALEQRFINNYENLLSFERNHKYLCEETDLIF
jgi:hypothetical protein